MTDNDMTTWCRECQNGEHHLCKKPSICCAKHNVAEEEGDTSKVEAAVTRIQEAISDEGQDTMQTSDVLDIVRRAGLGESGEVV